MSLIVVFFVEETAVMSGKLKKKEVKSCRCYSVIEYQVKFGEVLFVFLPPASKKKNKKHFALFESTN